MSYSLTKFARAAGIFEARVPSQWQKEFPQLPVLEPSGKRMTWEFFWVGSAMGEAEGPMEDDNDDEE